MQVDLSVTSIETCIGIMHVVDAVFIPAPQELSVDKLSDLDVAARKQVRFGLLAAACKSGEVAGDTAGTGLGLIVRYFWQVACWVGQQGYQRTDGR